MTGLSEDGTTHDKGRVTGKEERTYAWEVPSRRGGEVRVEHEEMGGTRTREDGEI